MVRAEMGVRCYPCRLALLPPPVRAPVDAGICRPERGRPVWRERMVPGDNDAVFADHNRDRKADIATANTPNSTLRATLYVRVMDSIVKRFLKMKIDKALHTKQHL